MLEQPTWSMCSTIAPRRWRPASSERPGGPHQSHRTGVLHHVDGLGPGRKPASREGHDPLHPGDAGLWLFGESHPDHDGEEPREDFRIIGRR